MSSHLLIMSESKHALVDIHWHGSEHEEPFLDPVEYPGIRSKAEVSDQSAIVLVANRDNMWLVCPSSVLPSSLIVKNRTNTHNVRDPDWKEVRVDSLAHFGKKEAERTFVIKLADADKFVNAAIHYWSDRCGFSRHLYDEYLYLPSFSDNKLAGEFVTPLTEFLNPREPDVFICGFCWNVMEAEEVSKCSVCKSTDIFPFCEECAIGTYALEPQCKACEKNIGTDVDAPGFEYNLCKSCTKDCWRCGELATGSNLKCSVCGDPKKRAEYLELQKKMNTLLYG